MELVNDAAEQDAAGRSSPARSVRLWLRLIGDFDAQLHDGTSILPVSKKARALLALVAANVPQPLRREVAASLLWSGKPKDHAANSLRQALRELQIALALCGQPPILLTGSGRLSLQADAVWIDINDPASINRKPEAEGMAGTLPLCQNLQGLDPAFDSHLERLWKNLVFHQAFVPAGEERPYAPARPAAQEGGRPTLVAEPAQQAGPGQGVQATKAEDAGHGQGWRIAVLPFRSLGAPVDGLSLSMPEEVSAALARFRMPRLIATVSFWDGVGPVADAMARARSYGLDYVISGTIQSAGTRIRVTVTLLDVGMDFEVIWASRFEGTTSDLFTLQDTIASQTVAQVDPELLQRHQFRGESARTANAAAHQAVLTAIQGIYRPDKPRFLHARDLLHRAIALDEDYAAAYAWLAYWHILALGQGWHDDPNNASRQAGTAAERAIVLDPMDARGISIAGHVKAYFLHDIDAALALHERAVTLNPNLPIAWTLSSMAHVYSGDHETALKHARNAAALSPSDPHVFLVEVAEMMARFCLKQFEGADVMAMSVLERKPNHAAALRMRIAILGNLGRLKEAAECLETLRGLGGDVTVGSIVSIPPLRPADRELYSAGLRRAGMADI